ncbi:DUF6624 domain-containing protein [Streptomyces sp. CFMR 7]|uniref:DUF6624 domain-containing protein n=1 Tax=Streptomyces sp. CFMR 7 TaxID=1649184 RepID=UPI00119E7F98|nr:DUF6624 domain-containing protein [Streptomyces sp. CFMR 7]
MNALNSYSERLRDAVRSEAPTAAGPYLLQEADGRLGRSLTPTLPSLPLTLETIVHRAQNLARLVEALLRATASQHGGRLFLAPLASDLIARVDTTRPTWLARVGHEVQGEQLALPGEGDRGRENTEFLRKVIEEHGWPGHRLVGEDGAQAAYLIALYADHDTPFQWLASTLLGEASARGDAKSCDWAHLYDRCQVNSGKPQMYGTQYRRGPHGPELLPTRNIQDVDWRRDFMGLRPMAEGHAAAQDQCGADDGPTSEPDEEPEQQSPSLPPHRHDVSAREPPTADVPAHCSLQAKPTTEGNPDA